MEVVKAGFIDSDKWIGRCCTCNAIIRANEYEFTKIERGDYRNGFEDYSWYHDCPSCKKDMAKILFYKETSLSGLDLLEELK